MCFSSTASFAAGATLATAGTAAILTARRPEDRALAAVPLVLGVQQAVEGVVWASSGVPTLNAAATYGYVVLSHVWWPFYAPFAVWRAEPDVARRRRLRLCVAGGALVAAYALVFMLSGPVTSRVVGHSLRYDITPGPLHLPMFALYVAAVCGGFALSTEAALRRVGLLLGLGLVVSWWVSYLTLFSVWCFAAGVVTVPIVGHVMRGPQRRTTLGSATTGAAAGRGWRVETSAKRSSMGVRSFRDRSSA
jgi:hypothetical protein